MNEREMRSILASVSQQLDESRPAHQPSGSLFPWVLGATAALTVGCTPVDNQLPPPYAAPPPGDQLEVKVIPPDAAPSESPSPTTVETPPGSAAPATPSSAKPR